MGTTMKFLKCFSIALAILAFTASCEKEPVELDQSTDTGLTAVNGIGNLHSNILLNITEHRGMNSITSRDYQSATAVLNKTIWRVTTPSYRGSPSVSKSIDGINWSFVATIPNGRTSDRMQLVAFNGELWLKGYRNITDRSSQLLYKSSDGLVWHRLPPINDAYDYRTSIFVSNNRLYNHVGQSLFYTVNGINWVNVTHSMPNPFRGITEILAFNNRLYAFTDGEWEDQAGIVNHVEVWESTNGKSWSRLPSTGPFSVPKREYSITTFKGKLWAIGGLYYGPIAGSSPREYSYTRYNEIWSTEDAVYWHKYTGKIPFKAISNHAATVFNDKLWLFDGTPEGMTISPTYEIGL